MENIQASSIADVRAVAARIRALPDNCAPAFAAKLLTEGLMVAGWFMRSCHALLKWRTGIGDFDAWAALFGRNLRGKWIISENSLRFREQTARWCESGRDASSAMSTGGFNQDELDCVIAVLSKLEDHNRSWRSVLPA